MNTLPTTTSCYAKRIATLQRQLKRMLNQSRQENCTPEFLDLLEREIQPLYAAIWAMHAEVEQDGEEP
jgi:predicted metal-dependent hydrolase